MGQLTRGQIVGQGMAEAGNTSVSAIVNLKFQAMLTAAYNAWAWPFVMDTKTAIALPAGTQSLLFGAGVSETDDDTTRIVMDIMDPIKAYTSAFNNRGNIRIRKHIDSDINTDETLNDPTVGRAIPIVTRLTAVFGTFGRWALSFYPVPDIAYLLKLRFIFQPANLQSDNDIPLYPVDRTLIQMAKVATLEYMQDPMLMGERQLLEGLIASDRMQYGSVTGTNRTLTLDDSIFL